MDPIEGKGVCEGHQLFEELLGLLGLLGTGEMGGLLRGRGLGLCCRWANAVTTSHCCLVALLELREKWC